MRISRLDPQMTLHTRISQIKINRPPELTMKLITYYLSGPEVSFKVKCVRFVKTPLATPGDRGIFSPKSLYAGSRSGI